MKKLVTLASVGVFLLSLQGASLAQEKGPATPATPATSGGPPATEPSVTNPGEKQEVPEVTVTKTTKKAKIAKSTKKAKIAKKSKKAKTTKKSQKV